MPYIFSPEQAALLSARDYLDRYPRRGRAFNIKGLGLTFHGIRDCLSLGTFSQVLLPVLENSSLPFIFRESCPYRANEPGLTAIVQAALHAPVTEVAEAAPFFPPGAENLWHWTVESLPKLLALESMGYTGSYIVPPGQGVASQCLDMFGIAPERRLPGDASYRVSRLILPPRLSGFTLVRNMALTDFLRGSIRDAAGELPGGKRCYLRRTGTRKIINEEDLLGELADFDFEIMTPEELSLREQFRYMSNVECSLMAHGAGSTLILLQKPLSTAIELFGNRYVSYNNLHAVRLLKLRYHAVVEDLDISCSPDSPMDVARYLQEGAKADMPADLEHIRVLLECALRT